MPGVIRSSRERFDEYRHKLQSKSAQSGYGHVDRGDATKTTRSRSWRSLLTSFYGLLREQASAIVFALITLTISTVLGLIPPAATKLVIDSVLGEEPLPEFLTPFLPGTESKPQLLAVIMAVVVLIGLVRVAVHLWGRWYATRAVKRVQMSVRKRVFEHAVRLPMGRVHELKSGGISSVLRNDCSSVGDLIFAMLYNPWRALIQLVGSLAILAVVDWRLLIGGLGLLPIVFVTHRTWIRKIRPQHRAVRKTREEVDAQATESFGGMRVVRAFSRERAEATRNMKAQHLMGRQELHVWWWTRIVEAIWETVIPLASAALLYYGGLQVLKGTLTLGDLMMFLVYLLMLLEPVAVLAQSAAQFQNSLSGLDRILDLLDEDREMPIDANTQQLERDQIHGAIRFEDVSFHYDSQGESWALRNIEFEAAAGEVIALVGRSGAGKTTLCNLVARFYDPSSGVVTLDGVDLKKFDVEQYRRLLGIVEQDVFLFDGTVAENIGYARRDATEAEIMQAAQIAHAHEFIERLPSGYDTIIGERGVKLSGGQRQRLAIARAVLADPKILILDEATSNLDTESERAIQAGLHELMGGRTCFVIAHRLSTIANADRILVLEDGHLVEAGSHDELMQSAGTYRDMVLLQTGGEHDENVNATFS
ncbi:ABC transporter ATP-binding protein [Calycomorphotria hydatis]|uniref:Multidrug export ATP-binding/permease protein n=1 Tax=Calycomorphotria hydatis TaxID=2528027 RepID=A0A517T586_9PLAN|nr:ABC transporter ATP-binding protein [Calycomorphotria hydatis]QDT63543.1 Putative multidrug export ATP-binding/permease protein [Calycomorphotria hydatis]